VSYPPGSKTHAPGNFWFFKQQSTPESGIAAALGIFFHKKAAPSGCPVNFHEIGRLQYFKRDELLVLQLFKMPGRNPGHFFELVGKMANTAVIQMIGDLG
jgi:hypothetical protein